MKKIIFTLMALGIAGFAFGQTADLNGVTFGFGAGYSHTFDKTYDYSLTTDKDHTLKLQPLNKNAFVISSVVMVKLGKIAVDQNKSKLVKQSKKTDYNYSVNQLGLLNRYVTSKKTLLSASQKDKSNVILADSLSRLNSLKKQVDTIAGTSFWDHLSINLALDLVNVAPDVSFNKNVNGGIGFGYFITENLQAALFFDVSRVSQLRDYVVSTYRDKSIPNADGTNYNALDPKDASLFYNKTVSGLSFKLIFSLANKKASSSPGDN